MPFFMLPCCYLDCRDPGLVEISPSAVAPICQVGDQLELTCNTTKEINHRWEFTVFPENITHTSHVTSVGMSGTPPSLTLSTSMITFSRLSGPNSLPLISRIVVSPVTRDINRTVVNCFEGTSSTDSVATTTIRIIDPGQLNFGKTPHGYGKDVLGTLYMTMMIQNQ